MLRRFAVVATAASIAFGGFAVAAGAAGAAPVVVNAHGSANCSASGKAKISPALTNAVLIRTTTVKVTLTCTGTSGVTGGKATIATTSATAQNGCTGLASGLGTFTGTIKWKGAAKYNPSTVAFSNGEAVIGTNIGFRLPSDGPTPAAGTSSFTGSFQGEHAISNVVLDIGFSDYLAACPGPKNKGIKKLSFTGVRGPSTFNIAAGGV
jgi:hypothetical protein